MNDPYLLGIDLGTSSVKVIVAGLDGRVDAVGNAEYPIHHPQPLHAEQDPNAWWDGCVQAVRAALAGLAGVHDAEIAAIGLSGQMHGVVMLDRAQRLVAPAIIWPDQRSQRQVQVSVRISCSRRRNSRSSVASPLFGSKRKLTRQPPLTTLRCRLS